MLRLSGVDCYQGKEWHSLFNWRNESLFKSCREKPKRRCKRRRKKVLPVAEVSSSTRMPKKNRLGGRSSKRIKKQKKVKEMASWIREFSMECGR